MLNARREYPEQPIIPADPFSFHTSDMSITGCELVPFDQGMLQHWIHDTCRYDYAVHACCSLFSQPTAINLALSLHDGTGLNG